VEVLVALGVLAGLACTVAGVAAACRASEERAKREAAAARVLAGLYAAARMDAGVEPREVPGEEGRWAVLSEGGERVPVAEGEGGALRRRVEAVERREGGNEVAFEVMTEAALP
jgi:type II secretory pathway pseudopilin PulG